MAVIATLVMAFWLLPATTAAAAAPMIGNSTPNPIRNREATLRFSINPEGLETSYKVEIERVGYSLEPWEPFAKFPPIPAGAEPVAIEVAISRYWWSLIPGAEYHWRVTAWNDDGKTVGAEQFFTTTDGPTPVFVTATASQTGPNRVSFTGTVNPEGAPLTGCRFRWVGETTFRYAGFEKWLPFTPPFGETVPCSESVEEVGSGTEPVLVDAEATGLDPGEYVFRIEGENEFEGLTSAFEGLTVGEGLPFTVSAEFDVGDPPVPEPPAAPEPPVASPTRKPCSRAHSGRALHHKAHGKKHRCVKRPRHGRGSRR